MASMTLATGAGAGAARVRSVPWPRILWGGAGIVLTIVLWEIFSDTNVLPSRYFPPASAVLHRLGELLTSVALWQVVWLTLRAWAIGLLIAIVIAIPLGVVLGSSQRAYRFSRVVIEVLRPVPAVVIIPLALLTLGPTLRMKLLLIVYAAVWPLLVQTIHGVHGVDPQALQMSRAYRLTHFQRFAFVRLPGAAPYVATGLRISANVAFLVAIVAELVGSAPGLGNDILRAQAAGENTTMYAMITLTGAVGVLLVSIFSQLERKLMSWHPSQRGPI